MGLREENAIRERATADDFKEWVPEAMRDRLLRVKDLHAERRVALDGYSIVRCRECGWNWPCPTIAAIFQEDEP